MRYYTADNEDPDRLRPMTKDEAIQTYRQVADEDIDMLADLYLNFNDFDQIEFLIFRGRLSAAVLIANSVKKSLNGLASKYDAMRVDGSYAAPGWETETSENFDEKVGIPEAAYRISIGATILTAVAALESGPSKLTGTLSAFDYFQ